MSSKCLSIKCAKGVEFIGILKTIKKTNKKV